MPPLRERREDVPLLAEHFLRMACVRLGCPRPALTPAHLEALRYYDWPGNVRELENFIERSVILSRGTGELRLELPRVAGRARSPAPRPAPAQPAAPFLTEAEWRHKERENLMAALQAAGGRVYGAGGAAALLGLRPTTLASRMKALGIARAPERAAPPEP